MSERFVFHRLNDLPRPPIRREVVTGFAAEGEVIAIVGPPGTGKSALGVLLASCVASGATFLGRQVKRGSVVYIAAERRIESERRLLASGSIEQPIYVSGARPVLANPVDVAELISSMQAIASDVEFPIRLVIFDTAAKCFLGLDENSARDIGLAVEGLARIGEAFPRAFLCLLHHTDKAGHGMRGSSALLGSVDLEVTIKSGSAVARLEVTKANAVPEGQSLPFRLVSIRAADGQEVISARASEVEAAAANESMRGGKLPSDARTALRGLESLGGVGDVESWRKVVYTAFGGRTGTAKRVAFNKAKNRLVDDHLINIDGNTVSVSERNHA